LHYLKAIIGFSGWQFYPGLCKDLAIVKSKQLVRHKIIIKQLIIFIGYTIVTSSFSEKREKYLGYAEASAGIGLMLGPVIGSFMYNFLEYMGTFFAFTIILLLNCILVSFTLPSSLNDAPEEPAEEIGDDGEVVERKKITYAMFLKNRRSLFAYLSCAMIGIFTSYNSSFLSIILEDFGFSSSTTGYVMAIPMLTYTLSSIAVTYLVKYIPRRLFIFISFVITSISLILVGPSPLLGLPYTLWILIIGYALGGVGQGFTFIPLLPEIIDSVYL
jgi:DHA1 family solute carrier family 18 vesicular amine transporter 1/2